MCLAKLDKKINCKEGWKLFKIKDKKLYSFYAKQRKDHKTYDTIKSNNSLPENIWINEKDYRKSNNITESIFGVPKLICEAAWNLYPTGFHLWINKPKIFEEFLEIYKEGIIKKISLRNIRANGKYRDGNNGCCCEEIFIHDEGYTLISYEDYMRNNNLKWSIYPRCIDWNKM